MKNKGNEGKALEEKAEIKAPAVSPEEEQALTPKKEVGTPNRKQFEDGSGLEWNWDWDFQETPEFKSIEQTVCINPSEAKQFQNELAEIGKLAFEYLGTTDQEEVYKFLRGQLRRIPQGGSRVGNLLRQLRILWRNSLKEGKHE